MKAELRTAAPSPAVRVLAVRVLAVRVLAVRVLAVRVLVAAAAGLATGAAAGLATGAAAGLLELAGYYLGAAAVPAAFLAEAAVGYAWRLHYRSSAVAGQETFARALVAV